MIEYSFDYYRKGIHSLQLPCQSEPKEIQSPGKRVRQVDIRLPCSKIYESDGTTSQDLVEPKWPNSQASTLWQGNKVWNGRVDGLFGIDRVEYDIKSHAGLVKKSVASIFRHPEFSPIRHRPDSGTSQCQWPSVTAKMQGGIGRWSLGKLRVQNDSWVSGENRDHPNNWLTACTRRNNQPMTKQKAEVMYATRTKSLEAQRFGLFDAGILFTRFVCSYWRSGSIFWVVEYGKEICFALYLRLTALPAGRNANRLSVKLQVLPDAVYRAPRSSNV